jgi:hypothetical protein
LLNNDFSPENTIPIVNNWESIFENEIENTILRWGILDDMEEWRETIHDIRQFLVFRPCILKFHLEDYFGVNNLDIPCDNDIPADAFKLIIKAFPNPAKNTLYISSTKKIFSYELYDMAGVFIKRKKDCNSFFDQIDISYLSKGVYTLVIYNEKNRHTRKIIKI